MSESEYCIKLMWLYGPLEALHLSTLTLDVPRIPGHQLGRLQLKSGFPFHKRGFVAHVNLCYTFALRH